MTSAFATEWPVASTSVKRCQWVERGKRCVEPPTRYVQFAETDPLRAQVLCDAHLAAMEAGGWPQRWSAPESGYVLAGGLRFFVKPKPETTIGEPR